MKKEQKTQKLRRNVETHIYKLYLQKKKKLKTGIQCLKLMSYCL